MTKRPYRKWTPEDEIWMMHNYPIVSWQELYDRFPGMTQLAIQSKARVLNLYRDPAVNRAGRPRKFKMEDINLVREFAPHYHAYRAKRDELVAKLPHLTKVEIRYLLVQYATQQEEW